MLSRKSGIAYLAGFVAADGHLESTAPYITIASKDHEFLKDYVAPLIYAQTSRTPRPYWDKSAKIWKVRIYSRQLWTTLIQDYRIPTGRKASRILPPENLGSAERVWYMCGWFEGEGWLETMTVRRFSGVYEYPRIGFKVMNRSIRDWLLAELALHDIRAKGYNRRDGTYGLWINGKKAREAFLANVGFLYLPRNRKLQQLIRTKRRRISPN
jgi:hypothetical protein